MLRRGAEGAALADLVLDALVEHDEGVGGGADTDDEAGDAGQVQRVADPATQQDERAVDQQTRGEQGDQRDETEESVVGEHEDRHEDEADDTGDETRLQRGHTEGGGHRLGGAARLAVLTGERQRQRAVAQVVGELGRRLLGEVTRDGGRRTEGSRRLDDRRGDDARVQGDGHLLLQVVAGEVRPGLGTGVRAVGLEGEVDLHLTRVRVETAGDGAVGVDLVARQARAVLVGDAGQQRCRVQQVDLTGARLAGDQRQGRVVGTGERVGRGVATQQGAGRRLHGRVRRLTVRAQLLGDLLTTLRRLDRVGRLRQRRGGDLRCLDRVGALRLLVVHRVDDRGDGVLGLLGGDDAQLHPAVGHLPQRVAQGGHVRVRRGGHRAEQQLRGLADGAGLGGVLTRDRDDQRVTVRDHARTRDAHAVDTVLQDGAGLRQLVLRRLLALRDEGDAGTALQVDAQLRAGLAVTGEEHQRPHHGDDQGEQRQRALRPGPLGPRLLASGCDGQ